MTAFIKTISPNENDSNGTNLRLLSIYLRTWQNKGSIVYVSDVTEEDIYNDFIDIYGLNKTPNRDTVLLFISSLFQFDVPIPSKAVRQFLISLFIESPNLLNDIVIEGLLPESNNVYYLPHSVEACFLFKAICYKQKVIYIEKTEEYVKFFVDDFILKQNNPRKFEGEFRLLVSGLMARKEEFIEIIKELTEWERAKVIIEKINPGFIIQLFYTENGHDVNSLRNIYDNNNVILRPYILELSPSLLIRLSHCLENYLKYSAKEIVFFNNTNDLRKYLAGWPVIYNVRSLRHKFRRMIKAYSSEYSTVFEEFCKFPSKPYPLNTEQKNPEQLCFSKKTTETLVMDLKNGCFNLKRFERLIYSMNKNGFYFKNLNWRSLSVFISFIKTYMNEGNAEYFKSVTNTIVSEVLKQSISFQYASSEQLSRFFYNILSVDQSFLSRITNDDKVQDDAQNRIKDFEYTPSELYYFYYFYPQPWCKAKMHELIDQANTEQKIVIKGWHDKVIAKLDNNAEQIEKDSLLDYIHNKFFSGQQNN